MIALVGALRHAHHRSVPEIHRELRGRGVTVSERTVTNLLDRYEELVTLSLTDQAALRESLKEHKVGSSWRSTGCNRTLVTRCCG